MSAIDVFKRIYRPACSQVGDHLGLGVLFMMERKSESLHKNAPNCFFLTSALDVYSRAYNT